MIEPPARDLGFERQFPAQLYQQVDRLVADRIELDPLAESNASVRVANNMEQREGSEIPPRRLL